MSAKDAPAVARVEVKPVDHVEPHSGGAVNKVEHLLTGIPLAMAKARVGAAVREAIGHRQLKEFGDKGLMGNVISGEKAPDYLARIYQDDAARRRLAFALLKGDPKVRIRTLIEIDDDEVGR